MFPYCGVFFNFLSEDLLYVVWRTGMTPILTPHDGRRQFGLSGMRTCDHPHASPELYHCATDSGRVTNIEFIIILKDVDINYTFFGRQ